MRTAVLICLVFCKLQLTAQSFHCKTYTTRDGLSSNTVSYAVKDGDGFLWVATSNGLNRFDGNAFDHFFNNPADSTSIASNEIDNLFIDSKKNLWVTTMAGLSRYHPHTQTFSNYAPDTLVLPKIGHLYPAIAEDDDGNIWLGGWYDLLLFNPSTKKFSSSGWAKFAAKVKPANGNHSRVVILGIKPKSSTEFWVLTTYGLFSVHKKTLQFSYYPYDAIRDYYGCQLNYADQDGAVWIGTYQNGIISYQPSEHQWRTYATPVQYRQNPLWDWAYGITSFNADDMIYGTQKGLLLLQPKEGIVTDKIPGIDDNNPLPKDGYFNIVKDGELIWLLSASGLTKLYPSKKNFNLSSPPAVVNPGRLFPLPEPNRYILTDEASKKVLVWDKHTNQLMPVITKSGAALTGSIFYKSIDLTLSLIATDELLYRYNREQNIAEGIDLPLKPIADNPRLLRNMVTDHKGTVWIRDRRQGIIEYDTASGTMRYLAVCKTNEQTTFNSMYFDTVTNALWIGVENEGIYIYDPARKRTSHFLYNIAPSQKGATIEAMTAGARGIIYGCDISYGLFAFNAFTKSMRRYSSHDGHISDNCNFLCRDAIGNIWISSSEGISRFDTVSKTFSNYPALKEAANYAAFMSVDENGNVFLPSPDGYLNWNGNNFVAGKPNGKLYVRNCQVAAVSLSLDWVYQFDHLQNNLSFQFGYLSFNDDEQVVLQYRLNNSEWLALKNENIVAFSNLAPNRYVLEVREKSNPAQVLRIRFVITPPFYKSWWFLLLVAVTAVAFVFFLFKRRLSAIKKQAALKQKIAETEMMALRAQMNPHFIFNCISSIDNFILGNQKENASTYLNKFARLIRNVLDNSKSDVVPFRKDWETIQLYLELEMIRSNHQFSYQLQASEVLLAGHYKIPPLIVQPYIENAIHHGLMQRNDNNGKLIVIADIDNELLRFTIQDNGIGRERSAALKRLNPLQHTSYGMQLSAERIAIFNNDQQNSIRITDLKDEDGNATGTLVEVLLHI
jgi:ligand-binding sensor domain-containing protein